MTRRRIEQAIEDAIKSCAGRETEAARHVDKLAGICEQLLDKVQELNRELRRVKDGAEIRTTIGQGKR